jgi:uroporphyrinogen-III synthase
MAFAVLARDPAGAAVYAAAIAPLGLTSVATPVTRAAPAADPDALVRAIAGAPYAMIVVASARAAHELARAANRHPVPASTEIWAVGPATHRALEQARLTAQHPTGVHSGGDLARALVAARPLIGRRVLVPRAEDGRTELLEVLRAAGAEVVDVVAYRTLPAAPDDPAIQAGLSLLRAGNAAICAVFAPSQVHALASLVGPLPAVATAFCAIGETTAAALRAAGVAAPALAPAPTPEGMAQAVGSVYPTKT